MQKVLLSMALLLTQVSSVHAQELSVYGNLDLSVGRFKRNVSDESLTHAFTRVESGVTSGTYFGIKGQESLVAGVVASFKLESSVSADSGSVSGEFWGRTSELGLAADLGGLTVGRSLSLSFRASLMQSPFTVFRPLGLTGVTNFGAFQSNALTYTSPTWGGWQSVLQYSPSELRGQSGIRALQLARTEGPWEGALTWTEDGLQDLLQMGGSYRGSWGKVFVQWARVRRADVAQEPSHLHLGVTVPLLEGRQLRTAWTHAEPATGQQRDGLAMVLEQGLSPRVSVYAGWLWQCAQEATPDRLYGQSLMVGLKQKF